MSTQPDLQWCLALVAALFSATSTSTCLSLSLFLLLASSSNSSCFSPQAEAEAAPSTSQKPKLKARDQLDSVEMRPNLLIGFLHARPLKGLKRRLRTKRSGKLCVLIHIFKTLHIRHRLQSLVFVVVCSFPFPVCELSKLSSPKFSPFASQLSGFAAFQLGS